MRQSVRVELARIANGVLAIMSDSEGLIGEKLGSFRIESVLGSGAMGVVYRGTNETTGRTAAVKVVSAEFAQGARSTTVSSAKPRSFNSSAIPTSFGSWQ